jgi:hypothetical protein
MRNQWAKYPRKSLFHLHAKFRDMSHVCLGLSDVNAGYDAPITAGGKCLEVVSQSFSPDPVLNFRWIRNERSRG